MRGQREEHLQGHRKALPVHQVRRGKVHSAGGRRGPKPLNKISMTVTPQSKLSGYARNTTADDWQTNAGIWDIVCT